MQHQSCRMFSWPVLVASSRVNCVIPLRSRISVRLWGSKSALWVRVSAIREKDIVYKNDQWVYVHLFNLYTLFYRSWLHNKRLYDPSIVVLVVVYLLSGEPGSVYVLGCRRLFATDHNAAQLTSHAVYNQRLSWCSICVNFVSIECHVLMPRRVGSYSGLLG